MYPDSGKLGAFERRPEGGGLYKLFPLTSEVGLAGRAKSADGGELSARPSARPSPSPAAPSRFPARPARPPPSRPARSSSHARRARCGASSRSSFALKPLSSSSAWSSRPLAESSFESISFAVRVRSCSVSSNPAHQLLHLPDVGQHLRGTPGSSIRSRIICPATRQRARLITPPPYILPP